MDAENSNTPRTQDDSLLAAIEGNLSGMKHSDLVLTCEMLTRGRSVWRKEAEELRRQNEKLVESLKEAKEILSHFGWTSSDSTEVILKAERWLAAQSEKTK